MESIKVTPENLKSQATKVDNEAQAYYDEYRKLLSDIEQLTSSDWTGEDANEFRTKVQGFEADFNKMKELMNEYANFLRQAASNYQNTQENVKQSIRGLR